jgi:LuxR family maltose regulon positive regulatory protein
MASVSEITHPPLFRRHARRPRLTRLLDESTAQAILITAPAGYGKTTLAAEWLQGREDVVWYRATAASADLAAFSAGVADVVAPLVPGAGERLRQRLRVAEAPDKAVRPLADLLAQDLAAWPKDAWLVVDDYHLVADSTPVEEFVDWLLTLSDIRLLVTTRRRPIWASARRILYGEVTEIGRDQLAMTNEEAARVLDGRSSEAVRALVAQAEGWPALIGLAALSASSELPEERVSEALFRYFAEEVFRREPEDVQEFMLIACIPMTFGTATARHILGVPSSAPLVAQLREDGLLQTSGTGELRLHPLLREFLRRKLKSERPDRLQGLQEQAISAARNTQQWEDAFELAIEAERYDLASCVLGEAAPALLLAGRVETLERWFERCGDRVFLHPPAMLARAETFTRQGKLSAAASLAQSLAEGSATGDEHASRAWFLAGQALHLISDDKRAIEFHLKARHSAVDVEDIRNALWGNFIAAEELEVPNASDLLDELESLGTLDANSKLRLASGRILAAERVGSYVGMAALVAAHLPLAEYATDPMVKSSFFTRAADISIGQADYRAGHRLASRALEICTDLNLQFAMGTCLLVRGNAEIGLRQYSKVRETLCELENIVLREEDPYGDLARRLLALKLYLSSALTADLIDLEWRPSEDLQRSGQGEYWALLGIHKATHGDSTRAAAYARKARELSRGISARYYSRFAELIARARANGSRESVIETGRRLLIDAARDGFLDALVLATRSYPALFGAFVGVRDCDSILRRALRLSGDRALARQLGLENAPRSSSSYAEGLLTARESEVLRLLGLGLSNREIARQLVISPSTAKVHVHNILRKLGAENRTQAVVKARGIGLERA